MPSFACFHFLELPAQQLRRGAALVLYERHRLWAYFATMRIAMMEVSTRGYLGGGGGSEIAYSNSLRWGVKDDCWGRVWKD
jgi:hypothetical protein